MALLVASNGCMGEKFEDLVAKVCRFVISDPFHMDHFKVGRTRDRPTLHLSHAPANRVETGLDNRLRPTSEVGFDPVVSELYPFRGVIKLPSVDSVVGSRGGFVA